MIEYVISVVWVLVSVGMFYGFGTLDKRLGYDSVAEAFSRVGLLSLAFAAMYTMWVFGPFMFLVMLAAFMYSMLSLVWYGITTLTNR